MITAMGIVASGAFPYGRRSVKELHALGSPMAFRTLRGHGLLSDHRLVVTAVRIMALGAIPFPEGLMDHLPGRLIRMAVLAQISALSG